MSSRNLLPRATGSIAVFLKLSLVFVRCCHAGTGPFWEHGHVARSSERHRSPGNAVPVSAQRGFLDLFIALEIQSAPRAYIQ